MHVINFQSQEFGLTMATMLTEDLDGNLTIRAGNGTALTIKFKR